MQGFNMGRYVPPDQEGITTGNKLAGKHPLGARARNLHTTGELTVRFEMPFAIWCSTCQPAESVLIGQGVRFNAHKKKVGNYYSTPIYSFRMKHSICDGWIEIRTDPEHTEYVVTEGARRRATAEMGKGEYEESSTGAGEIRVRIPGKEEGGEEEPDPFAKFEGKVEDRNKYMTQKARMEELLKRQERDWEDPYEQSKRLRRAFRSERKNREVAHGVTEALKDKMSLEIELLDETEGDRLRAGMVDFAASSKSGGDGAVSLSSSVRTRPLFESQSSESRHNDGTAKSATKQPRGGNGKPNKKKKAADIAAERKALLQQSLSSNTRAAVDPFLATDDTVWHQSPMSAKRKKADIATPISTIRINKAGGADKTDRERGRAGDSHESSNNGGVIDGKQQNVLLNGSSAQKETGRIPALVDYGSESD